MTLNFTLFYIWMALMGLTIIGLIARCWIKDEMTGAIISLLALIPMLTAFILLLDLWGLD